MDRDKMVVIWMTEKEHRGIIDAFGGFILHEDRDESLGRKTLRGEEDKDA